MESNWMCKWMRTGTRCFFFFFVAFFKLKGVARVCQKRVCARVIFDFTKRVTRLCIYMSINKICVFAIWLPHDWANERTIARNENLFLQMRNYFIEWIWIFRWCVILLWSGVQVRKCVFWKLSAVCCGTDMLKQKSLCLLGWKESVFFLFFALTIACNEI